MKHKRSLLALSLVGATATLLPLLGVAQAGADYAPQPGDIVGVGGDTPQFAIDFGLNGDTAGAAGFNSTATVNRVVDFDATADGNARSAYTNSVTTGVASTALNPTDVLRAGTSPVQRVSSSGNAITALLADTGATETINYVFSASLPTTAQQATAATNGWDYLHVVEIGTDAVQIAVDKTATNAPSGLSAAELLSIYDGSVTKWNQLPGNSAGSSDTIIPDIPPSSSSIYKTFIADLTTANGGTAPVLASDVKTVEQNDPTAITSASTPADAIVPFSAARLSLWNSSYFLNSSDPYSVASPPPALTAGISLLVGTPGDTNPVYSSPITDYVIFHQTDAASATALEPGGTKNWVESLFSNPASPTSPYFARAATGALVAASGVTWNYQDLGDVA